MTHQPNQFEQQPDRTDASFGIIPLRRSEDGAWQCLLVLHRKGHWAFPKGHAEPGESPVQAALRELAEETGLSQVRLIDAPPFIEHYRFINGKGRLVDKTVTYYLAIVAADHPVTIDQQEILDHRWAGPAHAREQITFDEGKHLVEQVEKWIEGDLKMMNDE